MPTLIFQAAVGKTLNSQLLVPPIPLFNQLIRVATMEQPSSDATHFTHVAVCSNGLPMVTVLNENDEFTPEVAKRIGEIFEDRILYNLENYRMLPDEIIKYVERKYLKYELYIKKAHPLQQPAVFSLVLLYSDVDNNTKALCFSTGGTPLVLDKVLSDDRRRQPILTANSLEIVVLDVNPDDKFSFLAEDALCAELVIPTLLQQEFLKDYCDLPDFLNRFIDESETFNSDCESCEINWQEHRSVLYSHVEGWQLKIHIHPLYIEQAIKLLKEHLQSIRLHYKYLSFSSLSDWEKQLSGAYNGYDEDRLGQVLTIILPDYDPNNLDPSLESSNLKQFLLGCWKILDDNNIPYFYATPLADKAMIEGFPSPFSYGREISHYENSEPSKLLSQASSDEYPPLITLKLSYSDLQSAGITYSAYDARVALITELQTFHRQALATVWIELDRIAALTDTVRQLFAKLDKDTLKINYDSYKNGDLVFEEFNKLAFELYHIVNLYPRQLKFRSGSQYDPTQDFYEDVMELCLGLSDASFTSDELLEKITHLENHLAEREFKIVACYNDRFLGQIPNVDRLVAKDPAQMLQLYRRLEHLRYQKQQLEAVYMATFPLPEEELKDNPIWGIFNRFINIEIAGGSRGDEMWETGMIYRKLKKTFEQGGDLAEELANLKNLIQPMTRRSSFLWGSKVEMGKYFYWRNLLKQRTPEQLIRDFLQFEMQRSYLEGKGHDYRKLTTYIKKRTPEEVFQALDCKPPARRL